MTSDEPSAESPPAPRPLGVRDTLLVLLTAALWGGTPTAIQFSKPAFDPVAISGIRFALAGLFMVGWCWFHGNEMRLRRGEWWPSLGAGLFLYVQIGLFTLAATTSNASHSTLCINTFIFWVLVVEHFVTKHDRLNGARVFGVLLAVVGVVTLVSSDTGAAAKPTEGDPASLVGDVIMLVSAFVLALKIIYTKWATKYVEPGKLILWHDIIGTAFFAITMLFTSSVAWEKVDTPVVLGLLYQGLAVGGFCFAVQTALLKRHSASQITVFSFLTPLFGTLFAVLFRGDELSSYLFVAGFCIAAGILVVTLSRRAEASRHVPVAADDSEAVVAEVSHIGRTVAETKPTDASD